MRPLSAALLSGSRFPRLKLRQVTFLQVPFVVAWVIAGLAWGAPPTMSDDRGPNAAIVFSASVYGKIRPSVEQLVKIGVNPFVVMDPNVLLVRISKSEKAAVLQDKANLGIYTVLDKAVNVGDYAGQGSVIIRAVTLWNAFLVAHKTDGVPVPTVTPLREDSFLPPPPDPALTTTRGGSSSPPYGSAPFNLSEYLIGNPVKSSKGVANVLVSVIFPESNGLGSDGDVNTWSTTDMDASYAEIVDALAWWKTIAPPTVGPCLLFRALAYEHVDTQYEPVLRASTSTGPISCPGQGVAGMESWVVETVDSLDAAVKAFNPACYIDKVRLLADNRRIDPANDADWSFVVFVAEDTMTPLSGIPFTFPDGQFAFTFLGGPCMVMTHQNDGYSAAWMDAVCAHEMGHVFFALDEYCCASSPTDSSGYMNIINANHMGVGPCPCPPPSSGIGCIMRGQIAPFIGNQVCPFTGGQMGWVDSNSDGIMDIVSRPPVVVLNPTVPNPTTSTLVTYTGSAYVGLFPNSNPKEAVPQNWINVSAILGVNWYQDGIGPSLANPSDGLYDAGQEPFDFVSGPFVPPSSHLIQVSAVSTVGCSMSITGSTVQDILKVVPGTIPPPALCP